MSVKTYNDFLLEWGYGGEGGVASKDPITVKDGMLDEIDLREQEKDDDNDIVILKHFLDIDDMGVEESVVNELDPYDEDNWNETTYDYKNWEGNVIDFLLQLNDRYINDYLYRLSNLKDIKDVKCGVNEITTAKNDIKWTFSDISNRLKYFNEIDFKSKQFLRHDLYKYIEKKIK